MKKLNAPFYMVGKYSSNIFRKVECKDYPYLFSKGQYKTKITKDDLTEDYIEISSRSFWYSTGYVKTSGVKDVKFSMIKENHLYKDDYIYISYDKPIEIVKDEYGYNQYLNCSIHICGTDIIKLVLAIEKYSNLDLTEIKKQMNDKVAYLKEYQKDYYNLCFHGNEVTDIFDWYKYNKYV